MRARCIASLGLGSLTARGALVYGSPADGGGAAKSAPPPTARQPPGLLKKCAAEAVGTGLIVLLGCGSVCSVKYLASGMTLGGVSVIWGSAVALAVFATREISGAHLNPAITAALAFHRPQEVPLSLALPYAAAQTAGAACAAALNFAVFKRAIAALEAREGVLRGKPGSYTSAAGAFGMLPNAAVVRTPGALGAEVLATGVLSYLVFALTDKDNGVPSNAAPALIGAAVTTLVSVFGPVTGAGMNPARDVGPRLVTAAVGWGSASLKAAHVYTLGPIAGAIAGAGLYDALKAIG